MPDLILKSTGKPVYVADEAIGDAIASGLYEAPASGQKVAVEVRPGMVGEIDVADLSTATTQGATIETDAAFRERERQARIDREHSGVGGKLATVVESGLDTVSLGGYGVLADAVGGEEYREDRLERAEANPGSATVGKIGGVIATLPAAGAGGGALAKVARATPLGQVTRIGGKIAKAGEGATALTKGARVLAGGAFEGGIIGAGTAVEELNNSDDPLTWERVSSTLSSNMLLGAAVGAGANVAGKALEGSLRRGKKFLDDHASTSASRAGREIPEDLAKMTTKELRAAREAELDQLVAGKVSERTAAAERIGAYQQAVKDANPWPVLEGEALAEITKANKNLRRALGNKAGLADNPRPVLDALQRQEQALAATIASADDVAEKLAARNARFAEKIEGAIAAAKEGEEIALKGPLGRRFGQFDNVKVPRGGEVTASKERAQAFLDALRKGEIKSAEDAAMKALPAIVEQNKALQQTIRSAVTPKAELVSPRLTAIDDAKDALLAGAASKKSLPEQMLGGAAYSTAAAATSAVPLVGPLLAPFAGAKAAGLVGEKLFGRVAEASSAAAARMSKAVLRFLDVGTKVAPAVPVLASKVLTDVAYGPSRETNASDRGSSSKKTAAQPKLAELYRRRSGEVLAQVQPTDRGPKMRMEIRRQVAARLAPIAASSPFAADRLETIAARRIEFLASKLPKRPDLGMRTGPDLWQPSDMEMRTWARYAAAVEDPAGVVERLSDGTITPEDAEAIRAVYPEMFADIQQEIAMQLPSLRKRLPYKRRLALSIFSGIAVEPAMEPVVLEVLQAAYAAEPGTDGGMHAPVGQPQFGSVKVEDPTPAQERAG